MNLCRIHKICIIYSVLNSFSIINNQFMNNFYSNDVPPYSDKIYKIFNIENIFLKFLAIKKFQNTQRF